MITLAILFRVDGAVISEAKAEVAGMSFLELRRDRDFKNAVAYIVEDIVADCSIDGGYVEDGYLYGVDISC